MKNKNAIKNNMGQEVLKVVKVLHLSQSGTVSDMDSESRLKYKTYTSTWNNKNTANKFKPVIYLCFKGFNFK